MSSLSLFASKGVGVEVKGASKTYRTAAEEVHALRGVDWTVQPGQAVAIMGPSGCGKTTLMNLIGGVDRATSGALLIGGRDLAAASERDLEEYRLTRVGFVFQFFNLVPTMTAFENIELPMMVAGMKEDQCRERARALLELVGLAHKGDKRPDELSGGEQQRVGIVLALANDPAIILADEPTGNLDARNADIISTLLVSLARDYGKTVIMVSHDPKSVEHFPIEYAMRDGKFIPMDDAQARGAKDSKVAEVARV
jgi:putative ABC transport system ATP-binding protein